MIEICIAKIRGSLIINLIWRVLCRTVSMVMYIAAEPPETARKKRLRSETRLRPATAAVLSYTVTAADNTETAAR